MKFNIINQPSLQYQWGCSLEYTIEDYVNYTGLTWVTLDVDNNQLNYFSPDIISDTNYLFRIRTNEVSFSVYYYATVNLDSPRIQLYQTEINEKVMMPTLFILDHQDMNLARSRCIEIMPDEIQKVLRLAISSID